MCSLTSSPDCREYLATRLSQLTQELGPLFDESSLSELAALLFPPRIEPLSAEPIVQLYAPEAAIEFYNRIAPDYDRRNSEFLYRAHQQVVKEVRELLDTDGWSGVLDFGCGTGRLIAAHFVHRPVRWLAIDGSPQMLEIFRDNTSDVGAAVAELHTFEMDLAKPEFDRLAVEVRDGRWIVIMSFLLTSLPTDALVGELLAAFATADAVVIADIHPLYTSTHPNYDFVLADRSELALRPRPVYPDVLQDILAQRDFDLSNQHLVRRPDHADPYAFVHVYERRARL